MSEEIRESGLKIPGGAGLTAGIYAAALLAVFFPYLSVPGSLYARVVRDFWPLYNSLPEFDLGSRLMFHFGRFPLWNFLNGFGQPLLGDLQSAPFHPSRLIFLMPFWKVIDLWLLLRVFISGMITYAFLRSRGVTWHGSTFGGLAWMLTGSITDYINMHYLDVDLLLPAGAYCFGLLARRYSVEYIFLSAVVVLLAFLGGNPTSILYFLIFVTFYFFYTVYRLRDDVMGGYFRFFSVAALSFLASAILLLPFREFLALSWDYHPAGVGTLTLSARHLLTAFGPEVYGPEIENGIPLIQRVPYIGVTPLLIAFMALFCLRRMSSGATFFAGFGLVLAGMVAGIMPFNLLNYVPLFIRTSNFRYAVPEIAFCAAVLAGMGWDHLVRWREAVWRLMIFPTLLSLICLYLLVTKHLGEPVLPVRGTGLLFFAGTAWVVTLVLMFHRRVAVGAGLAGMFLFAAWTIEAAYHVHDQPLLAPHKPEVYMSLPKSVSQRTLLEGRIYCVPGILNPNLNIMHGAMDIRYLGALYVDRYARFMRLLNDYSRDEQLKNFIPYNYMDIRPGKVDSGLLDLMGITTIVSDVLLPRNTMAKRFYLGGKVIAPSHEYVSVHPMTIGDDKRITLYQHPPSRIIVDVPVGYLIFGIGIDPSRWDSDSDGVTFSVYDGDERAPKKLFMRHLSPAHCPSDRGWFDYAIAHHGGRLIFETTPGPSDSNDWAGWGDIRSSEENPGRYTLTQYVPMKIYENYTSLGAFAVGRIKIVAGKEEAASWLRSGMNFRNAAVVEGIDAYSLKLNLGPQDDYRMNVTRIAGDYVKVVADLKNTGVLVLNDAYYPGWRAYLDGEEEKIFPADLAFRAVRVTSGKHMVEFVYEPISFRIGLWASLATLLLFALVVNRYVRNRQYNYED